MEGARWFYLRYTILYYTVLCYTILYYALEEERRRDGNGMLWHVMGLTAARVVICCDVMPCFVLYWIRVEPTPRPCPFPCPFYQVCVCVYVYVCGHSWTGTGWGAFWNAL
jgi:hypothetical protein